MARVRFLLLNRTVRTILDSNVLGRCCFGQIPDKQSAELLTCEVLAVGICAPSAANADTLNSCTTLCGRSVHRAHIDDLHTGLALCPCFRVRLTG